MPETLAATPLTPWHRSAGARMAPFAGYEMPLIYESIGAEHRACRERAALFDVSHMGRLRFEGPGAGQLLDHLLSRRMSALQPGQVRYALCCNADGGVLDDVLVYRVATPSGADYFLMVVNASNREKLRRWIEPHASDFPDVQISDRTEITAMIALQGPRALEVAAPLLRIDPEKLKRYRAAVTDQFGKPCLVSRTGYTGEDGLELIVRADAALRVWENLLLSGRPAAIQPAGLAARDTLRLEAAMPLYGHELDESIDPLTAGLEWACELESRDFIGAEALREIAAGGGPPRRRVGLRIEGPRPARPENPVLGPDGERIGHVTSGTQSPTLGYPIAMALVARRYAAPDTEVRVDVRGKPVAARVVPLPFLARGGKRTTGGTSG